MFTIKVFWESFNNNGLVFKDTAYLGITFATIECARENLGFVKTHNSEARGDDRYSIYLKNENGEERHIYPFWVIGENLLSVEFEIVLSRENKMRLF
jgi:hypothetical protein